MVGVAGRSRGCKTCRRRRVKCDERHPYCKRCEKAGYTCEGYLDRNFIIFDNTIKHENAIQSYKSSKDSDTQSEASEVVTDFNCLTPKSQSVELTTTEDNGSFRSFSPLLVSPVMDREQVYICFMYTYFYRGAETRVKIFEAPGLDLNLKNSLAAMSVGALATTFFGFKTGTQAIMVDGQAQYGRALSRLNQALSHRSPKEDCDVLAAIVMLCLFEFMMPASARGWISHSLGLGTMFQLLGPELCSQPPYHTYFESCRVLIIYAQMTIHKDSFLADKKWLTIPWLTRPQGKTAMEQISDVMAQLCRVQKYWDDVFMQPDQERRKECLFRYQQQLALCFKELEAWASIHKATHENRRSLISHRAIDTILDKDDRKEQPGSSRPTLFEPVYNYVDLESANLICIYHAVNITLTLFVQTPPPAIFIGWVLPVPPPTPPKNSPIYNTFLHSAVEICKSSDFHLQEHQDSAGSFHLVFPMRMAARAFEEIRLIEEEKWATGILTGIANGSNRQWAFASQMIRENGQDVYHWRQYEYSS